MENISEHISFAEGCKSQEAIRARIDNIPNEKELEAMKLVAEKCFEPLRNWYGKPIGVSSFFRNEKVNKLVKGSKTSQHMRGEAIDIDADIFNNGITNQEIFEWLRDNVEYDQLIHEFGTEENPAWVHISFSSKGNKKQILNIK
jgi:zinc D-Ala-D-Ala carboxypeptidase